MKKKSKRKNILIAIIILFIVIITLALIIYLQKVEPKEKLPYEITSTEELLEYYMCKDIEIIKAKEEEFEIDIYLTFGKELWEDEKSNEAYYNSIIRYLSELLQYNNYRLIDRTRELVVAVIMNNKEKSIEKIYINGQLNYFEKEQTKKNITKYEKQETINMQINSTELKKYIQNNWNAKNVSVGSIESRYNDYDIYFEEGIELKTLGGKVFNLVFTEKYNENIVNGLKVNEEKENIIRTLGKPHFETGDLIGYKGSEIYIFFSKNAVSVYRIEKDYQTEKFLKYFEDFQENKDAKKFVNNITNLWTDSNKYNYDSNYIYLEYALRGISIQFNISTENGIILYKNFEGEISNGITLENINKENLPEHVYLHTDEDLVFLQEQDRAYLMLKYELEEFNSMIDENDYLQEEYESTTCFTDKQSELFYLEYQYVPKEGIREVKFVSKNREYPNSELLRHKQINSYGWINDEEFVYSVKQEGIYCYNAKTRTLKTLITGRENFEIKKIENNTLIYDNTNIKL